MDSLHPCPQSVGIFRSAVILHYIKPCFMLIVDYCLFVCFLFATLFFQGTPLFSADLFGCNIIKAT